MREVLNLNVPKLLSKPNALVQILPPKLTIWKYWGPNNVVWYVYVQDG